MTPHPIRCACGAFEAKVHHPERSLRAVCYCRDCQSYAHFLGPPAGMLDDLGGTDIVVVRPRQVEFTRGVEHLACMSLSPRGTLRWHTSCCRTPVGNTPRDPRISHLGLVHSCLEHGGVDLESSFGPVHMRVNPQGAKGKPGKNPPLRFAAAIVHYLSALAWSRLSGAYRVNPFFTANGTPRAEPRVLTVDERAALLRAV